MGGAQCGVYLDKGTTGMGMLDGLHPQKNSTTSKSVWDGNKPVDLVFEVRHSGITTKAGDQVIFAWTGEPQQLALFPAWKVPNPGSVFIGTGNNNGTMEISRIEIAPVDAPPKPGVKAEPRKRPADSKSNQRRLLGALGGRLATGGRFLLRHQRVGQLDLQLPRLQQNGVDFQGLRNTTSSPG